MLESIIFDFDGTLAETERDGHRVAYNTAFAQLGLDWTWDEALYGELLAVGGGKERIAHYLARYRRDSPAIADRDRLIAAVHERKQQAFNELAGAIALRPGVVRLVAAAQSAGIRLAIATTAAPAGVQAVLAREPRLQHAFAAIGAGDVVPNKKPAPDIYRYTLDRLGVAAAQAIAVEDAAIGVRSARAAGITTLATISDYTAGHDFTGAAAVLSDLGEPHAPARTLAGPPPPRGVVDIPYLRFLLGGTSSRP